MYNAYETRTSGALELEVETSSSGEIAQFMAGSDPLGRAGWALNVVVRVRGTLGLSG